MADPNLTALLAALADARVARDSLTAALERAGAAASALAVVPAPAPAPAPPSPPPPTRQARGINLVGMEGRYDNFPQATGPVAGTHYPVFPAATLDYYLAAGADAFRVLFSWDRLMPAIGGPIPAVGGNYRAYFLALKGVVDHLTAAGATVVLEPWQANAAGGVGGASFRGQPATAAAFADFWSRMAAAFKGDPRVDVGLANEPNGVGTLAWFQTAQAAVDAIRAAGFAGHIHVPGNGWTGASSWLDTWPDASPTKVSNATGWLNANGAGKPLRDPLGKLLVEVHSYAGADGSGTTAVVASKTVSRERVDVAVRWARANGLRAFLGEIGFPATSPNARENWLDFAAYAAANADVLAGWAWWAGGRKGWWDDAGASGGGHFSVTPTTSDAAGDTANMAMIRPALSAPR